MLRFPSLLAFLALFVPCVSSCRQETTAASDETTAARGGARKREVPRVQIGIVEQREMVQVLETTSKLESEAEIRVFPRQAGVVTEILAEEGDPVQTGAPLARLDDRDAVLAERDAHVAWQETKNATEQAKLAIEDASANVQRMKLASEQAERDYERDRKLFETGATASALSMKALEASRLARDNALADYSQAEIALRRSRLEATASETATSRAKVAWERAQLALSHTTITAPFDGIVAERMIRVGDAAGTGEPAFVLTDPDNLRAVFFRPQEELGLFTGRSDGQDKLTFTAVAEAYPGRNFSGEIQRISPTIDPDSGQFRVTARLKATTDTDLARLLPGMLVRMRIVTDRHPNALVVPKRATEREGDRNFVRAFTPTGDGQGTVHLVDYKEGYSDDTSVELVLLEPGALAAGASIVVVGRDDLKDGDPVQVVDPIGKRPSTSATSTVSDDSEGTGDEDAERVAAGESDAQAAESE